MSNKTMIPLTLGLALGLLSAVEAQEGGTKTLTLKKRAAKVGDRYEELSELNMSFKIQTTINKVAAPEMLNKMQIKAKLDHMVLGVNKEVVSKARLKFVTLSFDRKVEGKGMPKAEDQAPETSPISGKTAIITQAPAGDEAEMTVTAENGEEASGELKDSARQSVGEDRSSLFSGFRHLLTLGAMALGKSVEAKADKVKAVLPFDSLLLLESMTLTLKESRKVDGVDCAIFTVKVKAAFDKLVKVSLSGELSIGLADGFPRSLSLKGPMNLDSKKENKAFSQEVKGRGEMSIQRTFTVRLG